MEKGTVKRKSRALRKVKICAVKWLKVRLWGGNVECDWKK